MHPRLPFVILFSLHLVLLVLLILPVNSLPHPSNPSQTHVEFTPRTKHAVRSIKFLLTICCRDARLVSHKHLTLNQPNILTLPLTQQRSLQALTSFFPNLPNFQVFPLFHPDQHIPQVPHQRASRSKSPSATFYTKYHNLDILQDKWADLAQRYDAVGISDIGESIEGRPIKLLTIGATDSDNPKRILINALQHAREWIAAAAATFIAEKLAINSSPNAGGEDTQLQRLLRSVEVLIVPVVNPDGYVYTHTPSEEDTLPRYWRKNRRPLPGPCVAEQNDVRVETQTPIGIDLDEINPIGIDLNRNWPKDFGGNFTASSNQCSRTYTGTGPFSEPETKALSDLIKSRKGIMSHIDFHSYGQVILGPWASSDEIPERFCDYEVVGKEMANAMIGSSGSRYVYGSGPKWRNGAFAASGVITDWVHYEFPQTLSFAIELRPQGLIQGNEGFALSPDQILSTSNEAFSALRILLSFSNNPEKFLSSFPTYNECRRTTPTAPRAPPGERSSNVGLIAGAVVGGILAILFVFMCIMLFRIKRRRSREKQLEEANAASSDGGAKEGGSLESVYAIVKRLDTNVKLGSRKVPTISECEVPAQSPSHSEVLSTVSHECITPIGADEGTSAWSNLDGESSYGNTVLLDAQNPFFPGGVAAIR